ncbi:lipase family protein [uncultured Williamsia sp.]|uniref:lipase family protein n=1 Tax=uncultured Williamsia sp. TaxID=259311 RepID=UPI00260A23A6|nr:lipase family protein [uncultured Williamsia sp.]
MTGRSIVAASIGVVAAVIVAGCSGDPAPSPDIVRDPIPETVQAVPDSASRGALVSVEPLSDAQPTLLAASSKAVRGTYVSTDPRTTEPVRVTGTFFVPRTPPPPAGWPVISFAHGTTGATNGCGLSGSADLRGYAGAIAGLLTGGFAVAVTDYRGLGPDGVHLYLDPASAAYDVIDAARALRRLAPAASTRWLAYGDSQGGQAVWSAAELDSTYGAGMTMVGALATKPAANITAFADLAERKALSAQQREVAALVAQGAARASNGSLTLGSLLPDVSAAQLRDLVGCDVAARQRTVDALGSAGLAPRADAVDAYTTQLRREALPQRRSAVPVRVVYGLDDTLIPPAWVTAPIAQACAMGSAVYPRAVPGKGHADALLDASDLQWVGQRFAGQTPAGACP